MQPTSLERKAKPGKTVTPTLTYEIYPGRIGTDSADKNNPQTNISKSKCQPKSEFRSAGAQGSLGWLGKGIGLQSKSRYRATSGYGIILNWREGRRDLQKGLHNIADLKKKNGGRWRERTSTPKCKRLVKNEPPMHRSTQLAGGDGESVLRDERRG